MKDFRKQSAFFIMICSIDMHPENISLITYINPETKQSCELEEAMEYLLKLREEYFNKYLK